MIDTAGGVHFSSDMCVNVAQVSCNSLTMAHHNSHCAIWPVLQTSRRTLRHCEGSSSLASHVVLRSNHHSVYSSQRRTWIWQAWPVPMGSTAEVASQKLKQISHKLLNCVDRRGVHLGAVPA